jgi:hypothetical protein
MGRKPVFGLAGMFLASVTLTGCENTDWCCWGKKTPDPVQVRTQTPTSQKLPPKMWEDEPAGGRSTLVDSPIVPPADPSTGVPINRTPRSNPGLTEESDIAPPPTPKPVTGPDLNEPLPPLSTAPVKTPVTVPETNHGTKNPAPVESAPVLEDPLPSLDVPPPPKPVMDGSTKSSSKYQSTTPSPDDPPPPVGVPVIKGGGLKAN